jgi:hypothetical protein
MSAPNLRDAARAFDERLLAIAGDARDDVDRTGGQYATLDGSRGAHAGHAFAGFDVGYSEVNDVALNVAHNTLPGLTGPAGVVGCLAGACVTGIGVGLMLAELRAQAERERDA